MTTTKKVDFIGYSDSGIDEAIQNALQQAGEHTRYEVVETCGSQVGDNKTQYQVTITAFFD